MSRIVLIDDERILNETLKDLIELMGYEVLSFYSFEEAVKSTDFNDIELILCDVGLPGENVFELLTSFKDKYNIPFVLLSAFSTDDYIQKAYESGADKYLVKPVSIEMLRETFIEFLPVEDDKENTTH